MIKDLQQGEIELGNFGAATKIPLREVAAFAAAVDAFGGTTKEGMQGMRSFQQAIIEAGQGSRTAADEFKDVGINIEEWRGVMPDECRG